MNLLEEKEKLTQEATAMIAHVKSQEAYQYSLEEYERIKQQTPTDYLDILAANAEDRMKQADIGGPLLHYLQIYNYDLVKALAEVFRSSKSTIAEIQLSILAALTMVAIEKDRAIKKEENNKLIDDLAPIFYHSTKGAEEYISKIKTMTNREITDYTNTLIGDSIDVRAVHRSLYNVLHANNLYSAKESNWNKQIVIPKSRVFKR